jgi:subtilisin-like proprotein convertase family protein
MGISSMRFFSFELVGAVFAGTLILVGCGGSEAQDSRHLMDATCDSTHLWAGRPALSGLQIPDNDTNGITVTWDNQNCNLRAISSARLEICMNHTKPADLEWSITSPNSISAMDLPSPALVHSSCDQGQGQLHSISILSALNSNPITQGLWTLQVKDSVLGNTGTFRQWRVILQGLK